MKLITIASFAVLASTSQSTLASAHDSRLRQAHYPQQRELSNDHRVLAGLSPGLAADAALSVFSIAQTVAPLLSGMFGKGKKCQQVACWIATSTEKCGWTAANQVQRELMKGRNSFAVEGSSESGMWVRYWRTQFNPPDAGLIADGSCGGGTTFTVGNCQPTGKVYC